MLISLEEVLVNLTHMSYPRETETLIEFLTTNNTLFSKILREVEMFVVPKGLVHFQLNVGKGKARLINRFQQSAYRSCCST